MISITSLLKSAFDSQKRQIVSMTITPTTGSPITVTQDKIVSGGFVWDRYSSKDSFAFGTATAAQLSITLDNHDGSFDDFDFAGAEIYASIGCVINNAETYMPIGYFTIDNSPRHLSVISITALDRMVMFDKDAEDVPITYPCTVEELYNSIFSFCNVTCDTTLSGLPNYNYTIGNAPAIRGSATCRNYIQWLCAITGTCAQFGNNGHIKLSSYKPHTTGIGAATEQITPSRRYSSDIYDDVSITGISVLSGESEYISGSDGYVLQINDNPIIQENGESIADNLFAEYGLTFSPFAASVLPIPYLEPCDFVEFVDKRGIAHTAYITHITFVLNGGCSLKGSGKSKAENGWSTADTLTTREQEIIKQIARDVAGNEIGDFENSVIDLNNIIANALGLYDLSVVNQDGSRTYYYGNAPSLADSTVIYTFGEGGFAVTHDWNGGSPVWEFGFTQAGNAVFNALNAYKIQGKYIEAGAITADKITLTATEKLANGDSLSEIIDSETAELAESIETIRHHVKIGYLDEDGTQYGVEIGETIGDTFSAYARLQANRLSFYDNNTEVAYISNQKLYITNAEITSSMTIGNYIFDTSHGGVAVMWQGG